MITLITSLLPTLQHFRSLGYWLVLLCALLESLLPGFPGTVVIVSAGFLAARGYLDVGDVIWFTALGAIIGDGVGFYVGSKGISLFKRDRWPFKQAYLTMGEQFFKKHSEKSVFFGRFLGPLRPIIPFVAGLFKMDTRHFYFWNIVSAFVWAVLYVLLGYFFGATWQAIEVWSTRVGVFIAAVFGFLLVLYLLRWLIIRKGRDILLFFVSLIHSIKQAVITNPDVQRLVANHPVFFGFLKGRLTSKEFTGLPLTLLIAAFVFAIGLFAGLVQDIVSSDQIVAIDVRLANLLYVFRTPVLVKIFLWFSLLGTVHIVTVFVLAISVIWWLHYKKHYILPLWLTIAGSQLITLIGKISLHRIRPEGLVPVYTESSYSFPSGHATIAVAFYGFITYYLCRNLMSWKAKINALFFGLLLILAIGFSRLYLDVHFLSDVLSGYLVGMGWLIIGISIVEWRQSRAGSDTAKVLPTGKTKLVSYTLLIIALVFYVTLAWAYHPLFNVSSVETTQPIVVEQNQLINAFTSNRLPKFTETLSGNPQEPLSFIVLAQDDDQFIAAFEKAGWYRADPVTLTSLFNTSKAALTKTSYHTAPMTPSFWNNRVHDFGFEKPTDSNVVSERHHARFWRTNLTTHDELVVYIGTASFDTNIKWLVTHKIQPDIDTERELLFQDLSIAGIVANFHKEQFVPPTLGKNFSGDQFFTDGKVYVVDMGLFEEV